MSVTKQITNFDLNDQIPFLKRVTIAGSEGRQEDIYYKEITQSTLGSRIHKMGYICEPKGMIYPIFLTINGEEKEIQIGKTGMFEFQPEEYTNANDEEAEEKTATVYVTNILVPANIQFTLDYCYYSLLGTTENDNT